MNRQIQEDAPALGREAGLDAWRNAFELALERSPADHEPLEDHRATAELKSIFGSLPLHAALVLPEAALRRKIRVRGDKDRRMEAIIRDLVRGTAPVTVINHCCVFGRHAKRLARDAKNVFVVAADIDPTWQRMHATYEKLLLRPRPANYRFVVESVYESRLDCQPLAFCVFGGCGSLIDASFDLAQRMDVHHLVMRACCHENIGMNTRLSTRSFTLWNQGNRLKNVILDWYFRRFGYYGHRHYGLDAYPRSRTARSLLNPQDVLRRAEHAVDCWLCRTVIDLDRILWLVENGYDLLGYSEGMFVAVRKRESAAADPTAASADRQRSQEG